MLYLLLVLYITLITDPPPPSDVTLSDADCVTQCGYHTYTDLNLNGKLTRIKVAVAANPALKASCLCSLYTTNSESPNGNFAADGMPDIIHNYHYT